MNNPEVSDNLSRYPTMTFKVQQEYRIVSAGYANTLQAEVTNLILQGWKVTGGVTVDDSYFYQAMIREKP